MKIYKIQIYNYRILKELSLDVEEDLTLVIGKNNTGKTSILSILDRFLKDSGVVRFQLEDFNIGYKNAVRELVESAEVLSEEHYLKDGIKLRIGIEYHEQDDLSNIAGAMLDLDPENNVLVLSFEYALNHQAYINLRHDFRQFEEKERAKVIEQENYVERNFFDFLADNHDKYYSLSRRSVGFDYTEKCLKEDIYIDLDKQKVAIGDIINFKYISAKREVANKDLNKTLSIQTSRIYKSAEANDNQVLAVEKFKDKLNETDRELSGIYSTLFTGVINKVKSFGGIRLNESEIEIISTLKHRELLEGNTTVVYKHDDDNRLPEHHNGLGYMNLISMIFEIEILVHSFKREKGRRPADINLLFIEEPEAHTHPQMQYVFIKNIKNLLGAGIVRDDGTKHGLQYMISTHSSHIVADSDFDTIKYLRKDASGGICSRNLRDLKTTYETQAGQYQFLKQYLTISRAEIFFADKAILIEGDTERILMPTFMQKLDIEIRKHHEEQSLTDDGLPLLSQNISLVEVGAYSQLFEKFIDFLGIKCLVLTDIDACKPGEVKEGKMSPPEACRVEEGDRTSNQALLYYLQGQSWTELKNLPAESKVIKEGTLFIGYQVEEGGYHARTFEDAFIHLNIGFIREQLDNFKGLKNIKRFTESEDPYELAEHCIKKKTHFALDILFLSNEDYSNWAIPHYIKEGLLWLRND